MRSTGSKAIESKACRILLVDDDEGCRKVVASLLESFGHKVTAAESGSAALLLFSANPEYFDLVILDQEMPNLKGTEVAERLMGIRPNTPVMLFTGSGDDGWMRRARAIGVKEVVSKPLTIWNLLVAIDRTLPSRTVAAQNPCRKHLRLVV